jgi:hypothetical protein
VQGEFDEQKEALVKVETVATDAVAAAQGLQAEAAQGRAAKEREMEKRFVQQQQRAAQDASEELEAMDKKLTAECTALQAKLTAVSIRTRRSRSPHPVPPTLVDR